MNAKYCIGYLHSLSVCGSHKVEILGSDDELLSIMTCSQWFQESSITIRVEGLFFKKRKFIKSDTSGSYEFVYKKSWNPWKESFLYKSHDDVYEISKILGNGGIRGAIFDKCIKIQDILFNKESIGHIYLSSERGRGNVVPYFILEKSYLKKGVAELISSFALLNAHSSRNTIGGGYTP